MDPDSDSANASDNAKAVSRRGRALRRFHGEGDERCVPDEGTEVEAPQPASEKDPRVPDSVDLDQITVKTARRAGPQHLSLEDILQGIADEAIAMERSGGVPRSHEQQENQPEDRSSRPAMSSSKRKPSTESQGDPDEMNEGRRQLKSQKLAAVDIVDENEIAAASGARALQQSDLSERLARAAQLRARLQELAQSMLCPLCCKRQATVAFNCGHCYCGSGDCDSNFITSAYKCRAAHRCPSCSIEVKTRTRMCGVENAPAAGENEEVTRPRSSSFLEENLQLRAQ
eukprot:3279530-Rhodomonas_salina.1